MNKVKSRSYSYLSTCFFTMVPFALVACRPPIHSYDQRIVQLAFGLFCRPRITRNANKKQEGPGSSLSPNKSKLGRPFVSYVIEPLPRIALTPKAFMKADHKWNYYNNVQFHISGTINFCHGQCHEERNTRWNEICTQSVHTWLSMAYTSALDEFSLFLLPQCIVQSLPFRPTPKPFMKADHEYNYQLLAHRETWAGVKYTQVHTWHSMRTHQPKWMSSSFLLPQCMVPYLLFFHSLQSLLWMQIISWTTTTVQFHIAELSTVATGSAMQR